MLFQGSCRGGKIFEGVYYFGVPSTCEHVALSVLNSYVKRHSALAESRGPLFAVARSGLFADWDKWLKEL